MQTLLETLRKAEDFLGRKGFVKPKGEVEHLFAGVLGLKRLDLYLQFERLLTDAEVARLRDATVRRAAHEPLQHIALRAKIARIDLDVEQHRSPIAVSLKFRH